MIEKNNEFTLYEGSKAVTCQRLGIGKTLLTRLIQRGWKSTSCNTHIYLVSIFWMMMSTTTTCIVSSWPHLSVELKSNYYFGFASSSKLIMWKTENEIIRIITLPYNRWRRVRVPTHLIFFYLTQKKLQ